MNNRATTTWLAVLATAVAGGAPAGNGEAGEIQWPTFRQADSDRSGAISLDEIRGVPVISNNFALYDKNSDGRLSRAEYEAAKRAAPEKDEAGKATGTGARR